MGSLPAIRLNWRMTSSYSLFCPWRFPPRRGLRRPPRLCGSICSMRSSTLCCSSTSEVVASTALLAMAAARHPSGTTELLLLLPEAVAWVCMYPTLSPSSASSSASSATPDGQTDHLFPRRVVRWLCGCLLCLGARGAAPAVPSWRPIPVLRSAGASPLTPPSTHDANRESIVRLPGQQPSGVFHCLLPWPWRHSPGCRWVASWSTCLSAALMKSSQRALPPLGNRGGKSSIAVPAPMYCTPLLAYSGEPALLAGKVWRAAGVPCLQHCPRSRPPGPGLASGGSSSHPRPVLGAWYVACVPRRR